MPEGESKENDNSQFINQIGVCENHSRQLALENNAGMLAPVIPSRWQYHRGGPAGRGLIETGTGAESALQSAALPRIELRLMEDLVIPESAYSTSSALTPRSSALQLRPTFN